jgi:hypothetical protein
MIAGPISVTVEAVPYVMDKINQDNQAGTFFARAADGLTSLTLQVKHTYPAAGSTSEESHLVRCDFVTYDTDLTTVLRTTSAWMVLKTGAGSVQDTAEIKSLYLGLVAAMAATSDALTDQVLSRQP